MPTQSGHVEAFAGIYPHLLWNILVAGFAGSGANKGDGGDFWRQGCFCTPFLKHAERYAVPTNLFEDGVFHSVVLILNVDAKGIQHEGEMWDNYQELVVAPQAVRVKSVLLKLDVLVVHAEHRVYNWEPDLEAILEAKLATLTDDEIETMMPTLAFDSPVEVRSLYNEKNGGG